MHTAPQRALDCGTGLGGLKYTQHHRGPWTADQAFDTLDHIILLEKLKYYGINGVAHELIENYINRKQYVEMDGTKSNLLSITTGVPQGSILGLLLFIIYINDISNARSLFDFITYADDTTLHHS